MTYESMNFHPADENGDDVVDEISGIDRKLYKRRINIPIFRFCNKYKKEFSVAFTFLYYLFFVFCIMHLMV